MNALAKKTRVLVVDDSTFMRKVLHTIITADPQMEVVGQAKDGREAVSLAESLKPDVITMDIRMPHMDGLQATELIMSQNPRPILIVSSESREGAASTLRALELGAVDFVAKPSSGIDLDMHKVSEELTRKLKMAAKVRVVRTATRAKISSGGAGSPQRAGHSSAEGAGFAQPGASASKGNEKFPLVVVAASTGGPAAIMRFVPAFPKDFPGAVFLILHMPATFTAQFSQQLAEATVLAVKEAENNEMVQPGTVYVCPGSHHLRISPGGRIELDDGPRISGYRPCADVTLETAAACAGPLTIGVVLTGMGDDAAKGVRAVRSAGGYVVAQDEATSVIFGMPAEAIKTGAVDRVLALDDVYAAVEKRVLLVFSAPRLSVR